MNSVLTLLGICLLLHSFVESATPNKAKECYLAKTCIHSGNKGCGVDSEGTSRWFLDSCDIHEYNCIYEKDYKKASIDNCDNLAPERGAEKHEEVTTDKNLPPIGSEDYGPEPTLEQYDEKDTTNNNLPHIDEEQYAEATLEQYDEENQKNNNIPPDNKKFFDNKFFGNDEEEGDKLIDNNYEHNDYAYQLSDENRPLYDDYDREYELSDKNYNTKAKDNSDKFFETKFFENKYEADGDKPEKQYDDHSYPPIYKYEQNKGVDELLDYKGKIGNSNKLFNNENDANAKNSERLNDDTSYNPHEDDYEQNEGVDELLDHKAKKGNSNKFFKNKFFDNEKYADAEYSKRMNEDTSYNPREDDYDQNESNEKLYDQDYPNIPLEDDYEQNERVDGLVDYKDNTDNSNQFFKSKFFENENVAYADNDHRPELEDEDRYVNTDKNIANDHENVDLLEDESNASVVSYENTYEDHPSNNYYDKLANNKDKKFFSNNSFD